MPLVLFFFFFALPSVGVSWVFLCWNCPLVCGKEAVWDGCTFTFPFYFRFPFLSFFSFTFTLHE